MEEKLSAQKFADTLPPEDEALLREMFEAGVHWGRRRPATHPKMRPFLFSSRGELEVIDLVATIEALKKALEAVSGLVAQGKTILLIGTQPAARGTVEEVAKALGFPYVTSRWLGGTLTNFKTFQGRIAHFKSLGAKIDSPDFEKYTKRERLQFQTEHRELKEKFTGILEITSLPGAVFVIGVKRHATAVKEAHKLGIPVVAVVNTDDDPTAVTWPIPANDNSAASVKFILEKFRAKVEEARKKVAAAAVEASEKKE